MALNTKEVGEGRGCDETHTTLTCDEVRRGSGIPALRVPSTQIGPALSLPYFLLHCIMMHPCIKTRVALFFGRVLLSFLRTRILKRAKKTHARSVSMCMRQRKVTSPSSSNRSSPEVLKDARQGTRLHSGEMEDRAHTETEVLFVGCEDPPPAEAECNTNTMPL